jgi:hypothetical protein
MITRRATLTGSLAILTAPALLTSGAYAAESGRPLPIPPLMDVDGGAGNLLTARKGQQRLVMIWIILAQLCA